MSRGHTRRSGRWTVLLAALRSSIWPVPVAAIAVAVGLGILLPDLDEAADSELPPSVTGFLFGGGAEAARAVLQAFAGSLITATSLTFSLTVVALQLASSQASPRLLRLFAADRMVHATMAVFLGTFAYCVTVLRTVRTPEGDEPEFVPRIAVTIASVLTLASVVMLALFLAHLARELRVETMLKSISEETRETLRGLSEGDGDRPVTTAIDRPASAFMTTASRSGFLLSVDRADLLDLASERDLVIAEEWPVGANVIEGSPVAYWWPRHGDAGQVRDAHAIDGRVRSALHLGFERGAGDDFAFGLRQIVDVALKAVSPGVNDPTTAVHALGHASALLCAFVQRPGDHAVLADDDGVPRLIRHPLEASALLELTLGQLRLYGASDIEVALRMLQLLREVAFANGRPELIRSIRTHIERVLQAVRRHSFDDEETERIEAAAAAAFAALGGAWTPAPGAGGLLDGTSLRAAPSN